jgi:hypothetical protein
LELQWKNDILTSFSQERRKKMKIKTDLSSFSLHILAMALMLCDHLWATVVPGSDWLTNIGRLAFPIFAFMIAEGCKYTRNKRRYFGQLFGLALGCQIVYFITDGSMYLSVLFTFSLSVLTIFALQYCKAKPTALPLLLFITTVVAVYVLNQLLDIDYGFFGCMLPVFAAAFHSTRFDKPLLNILMLALGLLLLWISLGGLQLYALAAVPLLLCYSGRRGKIKMKYFFYIFYPAHLALLQVILWLTA